MGLKRDFRLVVRGAARNMGAILEGSCEFTCTSVTRSVASFFISSMLFLIIFKPPVRGQLLSLA